MRTCKPRSEALCAYSNIHCGVLCADTIHRSCSTPKFSRIAQASRIVGQSLWEPNSHWADIPGVCLLGWYDSVQIVRKENRDQIV